LQPGRAQAREEPAFERAQRDAHIAAQYGAQLRRSRSVRPACQHRLDLGGRRAVTHAGLVAGPREIAG